MPTFNRDDVFTPSIIRELLQDMGLEFVKRGQVGEIAVFNGRALVTSTTDNAGTPSLVSIKGDKGEMTAIADAVGERYGLQKGWMTDAVAMLAENPGIAGDFPNAGPAGLRIFEASPAYRRFLGAEVQKAAAAEMEASVSAVPRRA
jgi:hypothetical protein